MRSQVPLRRRLLFCTLIALLFFGALEFGLRLWGGPLRGLVEPQPQMPKRFQLRSRDAAAAEDAYRRHARENDSVQCRTGPDLDEWITPDRVDPDAFNIFLVGGSAMFGMGRTWEEKP